MTIAVVVGEPPPCVTPAFGRPDGVRVVEAQQPRAVPIVQGQRVADAVRHMRVRLGAPRFDLDPETVALVVDLVVEQQ